MPQLEAKADPANDASPEKKPAETADGDVLLRAIQRMASGDASGLDEFFRICGDALFSYACRALPSRADAEEVLQDTLVRVWNKAGGYDPVRSNPLTWSMMILRGLVFDRLRHSRRRVSLLPYADMDGSGWPASAETWLGGERTDWETAWSKLNPAERETLELAIFTPATAEEIARQRSEPVGTVKTRTRRGLLKLREMLFHDAKP